MDCLQGVPVDVRSFGSAVSRFHISPFNPVKPVDIALTSDAAQVAGLGRIYFAVLGHRFSRIHTDQPENLIIIPGAGLIVTLDNSLFVLLYWLSTYAAEKILFVSSFPKRPRDVHKRLAASISFALGT
jgi:hypothetical protein